MSLINHRILVGSLCTITLALSVSGCSSSSRRVTPTTTIPRSATTSVSSVQSPPGSTHESSLAQGKALLKYVITPPAGFLPRSHDPGDNPTGVESIAEAANETDTTTSLSGKGNLPVLLKDGWQAGVVLYWVKGPVGPPTQYKDTHNIELMINRFVSPSGTQAYLSTILAQYRSTPTVPALVKKLPQHIYLIPGDPKSIATLLQVSASLTLSSVHVSSSTTILLFTKGVYLGGISAPTGIGAIAVSTLVSLAAKQYDKLPS